MFINKEFLETVDKNNNNYNYNDGDNSSRKELFNAVNSNKIFQGYCIKCNAEGNLTIRYGNVNCIMKRNDVTVIKQSDGFVHKGFCQNKVGTNIKFRVTEVDKDGIIYVSRKEIIEDAREKYNKELKIGDVITGVISDINEKIGCFVNIGADYDAILPKSKIEHVYIEKITDHVNKGDLLDTVVTDITKDKTGNITEVALDRLQLLPKFEELASEYSQGDVVIGTVKYLTPKSIYSQLTKHLNIACRPNKDIFVSKEQLVKIRIKRISTDGTNKMVGEIIGSVM